MTARTAGAVLVMLAGVWCGMLQGAALRRSLARQEGFARMLEGISYELTRFRTPLPELFAVLSERMDGAAGRVCLHTAEALGAGAGFSAAWTEALSGLPGEERDVLLSLAPVLGRYGAEEQSAAVEGALCRMEALCAAARPALREKCRVRLGVCAAAGAVLAVMLF